VVSGCHGRPDGWTVGVKLAANSHLKAVCATADLLRLGVGLLDRIEHRLWVGRLSHGLRFLIDPVANERIIPTLSFSFGLEAQIADDQAKV